MCLCQISFAPTPGCSIFYSLLTENLSSLLLSRACLLWYLDPIRIDTIVSAGCKTNHLQERPECPSFVSSLKSVLWSSLTVQSLEMDILIVEAGGRSGSSCFLPFLRRFLPWAGTRSERQSHLTIHRPSLRQCYRILRAFPLESGGKLHIALFYFNFFKCASVINRTPLSFCVGA